MSVAVQQHGRPTPGRESLGLSALLPRIAVVGLAGFAGSVFVAGALNPGYSHRSEDISALASLEARASAVMTIGFLLLAAAFLAAGFVLTKSLAGRAGRTASVLIGLAGAALTVVAFAREDCSTLRAACAAREQANTVSGAHVVHNLVSLALFIAIIVALFLLPAGLRRRPGTAHLAGRTRWAGIVALALLVWFGSDFYGHNGGLVERMFLLVACGWPVYLATRVARAEQLEHDRQSLASSL